MELSVDCLPTDFVTIFTKLLLQEKWGCVKVEIENYLERRMFELKKVKISAFLAVLILIIFAFSACNLFQKSSSENPVSSSGSSANESSSQISSALPPESSSSMSGIVTSDTGDDDQVIPIVTDNKEFDKKFAQNPIDNAYKKDSLDALSNTDIINVSNKYSDIWKKEIDSSYKKLLSVASETDKNKFKAEQEKWVSGLQASLKKIASDAKAEGGSMVQVQIASKTMDFYRARCAEIYHLLYNFDKNYTYEFK